MPAAEVLRAATSGAAHLFLEDPGFGTIEPGKSAAFHAVGTRSDAVHGESGFLTLSGIERAGSWSAWASGRR